MKNRQFDLCQEIIDIFTKKAKTFDDFPSTETLLGKSLEEIPQKKRIDISKFFKSEVKSFTGLLEKFSYELNNTLTFDLHKIYSLTMSNSEKIIEIGSSIIKDLPEETKKTVKQLFRYAVWPWTKKSFFVSRGFLKPYGYPGDYIIVEEMYNGNAKSMGIGYIYDTIFLETQLCQGLRNRKDAMKQLLFNYCKVEKDKKIVLLNVGCGGSRELREIDIPKQGEKVTIYLMDFDRQAIDFSLSNLNPKLSQAKIIPLKIDVRKLIKQNSLTDAIAKCNIIYSIGLFDYLPDKLITKLIKNFISLLKDNGSLIFAHKDYTLYSPKLADWFCNWQYYPRTQQTFEQIFIDLGIKSNKISYFREKDGYIFFAKIDK